VAACTELPGRYRSGVGLWTAHKEWRVFDVDVDDDADLGDVAAWQNALTGD